MKKIGLIPILLVLSLTSFQTTPHNQWLIKKTTPNAFIAGEHLTYNVHYGWLDAGVVDMTVDPQLYVINEKPCYKVDVAGESKGLLYLFLKMKNHFRSYLDTEKYVPQQFYRDIEEGKYKKKEQVTFSHQTNQVIVETLSDSTSEVISTETFVVGPDVQDIVSSWYVLRHMDFSTLQVGDIVYSPIFFDNILYEKFQTKFLGKKKIKTKLGYINTLVLAPVVPFTNQKKSVFADENSVELFLSDDENKVPVKIKVKLLVGAVEIDLVSHHGLQYPLALHKKK
jgi:hypothetical protein